MNTDSKNLIPVSRPVLRYHGGKWRLAKWVIQFFPPHRTYVEPFGGGASVLLQKPRSHGEIYNDLDSEVVNVFRVLRDAERAQELFRRVSLTPFSREEFRCAYGHPTDDVDRARKMIVRAFMGFGSASMTRMHITGFRSNTRSNGSTAAQDWSRWPDQIEAFTSRLTGVVIENRDAIEVISQHDSDDTLFYVDPPYPQITRSSLQHKNGNRGHYYRHDMNDEDHRRLATALHECKGMVVISGYACRLYVQELYPTWDRTDRATYADGARKRMECLWISPAAKAKLHPILF